MHKQAAEVLKNGGVIAYPTEAVYGLGCDPQNHEAIKKLIKIKNRPDNKGLIIIASNFSELKPYVQKLSPSIEKNILATWPGFITWLMPARDNIDQLLSVESNIAVRVSNHPDVIKLCKIFGGAIVSTSANLSGENPIKNFSELEKVFKDKVDFFLEGKLGGYERPSMIIDSQSGNIIRK